MQSRGVGCLNVHARGELVKKPVIAINEGWSDSDDENEVKVADSLKISVPVVDEPIKNSQQGSVGVDFGDVKTVSTVPSNVISLSSSFRGARGRGSISNNFNSSINSRMEVNSENNIGIVSGHPSLGQQLSFARSTNPNLSRGTFVGRPIANYNRSNIYSNQAAQGGFGKNFGNKMNLGHGGLNRGHDFHENHAEGYTDFNRSSHGRSNHARGFFRNFSSENNAPTNNYDCGNSEKCFHCQRAGHVACECPKFLAERAANRRGTGEKTQKRYTKVYWEPYTDNGPSYVPVFRSVNQIFEDDVKASENYLDIRIQDDEVSISGAGSGDSPVVVIESWSEANLHERLRENINRARYVQPRKIQSYTIPLIAEGHDLNGVAETGSGKSAAFLIPIIDIIIKKKETEAISSQRSRPIALIIEPTREMAVQLSEQAKKLTDGTDVTVAVAYGKFEKRANLREISEGCDILVGTPGRLKDFFSDEYLLPENLKFLVFDEADCLLEDKFLKELRDITSANGFPKKEERQTIFVSATCPKSIQLWAKEWMRPKYVFISNKQRNSANHKINQHFIQVSEANKMDAVLAMLKKEKEEAKRTLPNVKNPPIRRTLIFMNTKRACDVLASFLSISGIESVIINGDQPQETRDKAVQYLRKNEVQVAVTTDVCARGIDIKDLDHVINAELPVDYFTYVHRIGRTGRLKAGHATSCFNLTTDAGIADKLVKGVREMNQEVPAFLLFCNEKLETHNDAKEWGLKEKRPASVDVWE